MVRSIVAVPVVIGTFAALAGAVLSGCQADLSLERASSSTFDVQSGAWSLPEYLEVSALNPAVDSERRSAHAYEMVTAGDEAHLAMTLYQPLAGRFVGYTRTYTDGGVGWASPGTAGFRAIALSDESLGYTAIAASPDGAMTAVFAEAGGSGAQWISVQRDADDTEWGGAQTLTPADANHHTQYNGNATQFDASPIRLVMDSSNRSILTVPAVGTGTDLLGSIWAFGAAMTDFSVIKTVSGSWTPSLTYDGGSTACVAYLTGAGHELDCVTPSGGWVFSGAQSLAGAGTAGWTPAVSAADDDGNLAVVSVQTTGGEFRVFASVGTASGWSASASQIDAAMPSGYQAVVTAAIFTPVGVTHLGAGKFIAAWSAYDSANEEAAFFYSIYTPGSGWSEASQMFSAFDEDDWEIADGVWDYSSNGARPHLGPPVLFSDGAGRVGMAARFVSTQDASDAEEVSRVMVSVYTEATGWLDPVLRGAGCQVSGTTSGTEYSVCTYPPRGVFLPSGRAVVVFQDQDGSRFRLASTIFEESD